MYFVMWVILAVGVTHSRHRRVRGNRICEARSGSALRLDAQLHGLETFEHDPGIERRTGGADMTQPGVVHFGHVLRVRQDGTGEDAALPVHVLGGGIGDDIRAKLEWSLEHGGGEHVVDHEQGAGLLAELCDRCDVDAVEQRIGRALDQDELAALADLALPGRHVGAVHEHRLYAKLRHLIGEDPAAGAEQRCRGHDTVAGFQRRQDRRGDCAHAGAGHAAGLSTFDQAEALLQHLGRRAAIAGIDEALFLAGHTGFGLLGRIVGISGGQEDRLGNLAELRAHKAAAHRPGGRLPAFGPLFGVVSAGCIGHVSARPCVSGRGTYA